MALGLSSVEHPVSGMQAILSYADISANHQESTYTR